MSQLTTEGGVSVVGTERDSLGCMGPSHGANVVLWKWCSSIMCDGSRAAGHELESLPGTVRSQAIFPCVRADKG